MAQLLPGDLNCPADPTGDSTPGQEILHSLLKVQDKLDEIVLGETAPPTAQIDAGMLAASNGGGQLAPSETLEDLAAQQQPPLSQPKLPEPQAEAVNSIRVGKERHDGERICIERAADPCCDRPVFPRRACERHPGGQSRSRDRRSEDQPGAGSSISVRQEPQISERGHRSQDFECNGVPAKGLRDRLAEEEVEEYLSKLRCERLQDSLRLEADNKRMLGMIRDHNSAQEKRKAFEDQAFHQRMAMRHRNRSSRLTSPDKHRSEEAPNRNRNIPTKQRLQIDP